MKYHKYLMTFLFNIITIPMLLVIQEFIPDKCYTLKDYLLITLIILIIIISGYIEYRKYILDTKIYLNKNINKKNQIAKTVLSQVLQLKEYKSYNYCKNTYEMTINNKEWPYFYNVHDYLNEICLNLKLTIAKIIKTEREYVDVSLIYKYHNETDWNCLSEKSGISENVQLNDFIADQEVLYNYVLHHKEELPIFCNDKKKTTLYKLGKKDNLFDGEGSFYTILITFANNKEILVEAILLISTYGVNFVLTTLNKKEQDKFREILSFEIMPYYISIIHNELGALYMRHNLNKIKLLK